MFLTIHDALLQGTSLLADAGVPAPRLTAEVLLAHALKRERSWLYGHPEERLREVEWIHYGRYLHQRTGGTPAQYITGVQEFYGRPFKVTPAVLIPRPETEHVVEAALALKPRGRFVDVGCGSGAIAITLALETAGQVTATDLSPQALEIGKENARMLGANVQFVAADLASAIADRSIDLLVSNPPYVPAGDIEGLQREVRDHEPHIALIGGPTGNEIYERLVGEAARVLRPGGHLIFELGYRSADRLRDLLAGWKDVRFTADLAGIPRVVSAAIELQASTTR